MAIAQNGICVHTVRALYDSNTFCNARSVCPPGRRARMSGCAAHCATRSARPAITPHCGPPRSLSPLNVMRSAPSAIACRAAGSCAIHDGTLSRYPCNQGAVLSRRPEPISATTGTSSVASSEILVCSMKPSIEKFEGCTFSNNAMSFLRESMARS